MVFFNYSTMQMAAKVVYYGPGLCGKTTNLQWIFDHTSNDSRGEMVSLATETDRTLFFDLLPIDVGSIAGFSTRIQLYTVPGQVFYNTTRKLVLKGVDGVVFVADSQRPMQQANKESFQNLEDNLAEMGLSLETIPLVLQYNKRDLPNIASIEELNQSLNRGEWGHIGASALNGDGVLETLKMISKATLLALKKRLTKGRDQPSGSSSTGMKARPAPPRKPPPAPRPAPGREGRGTGPVAKPISAAPSAPQPTSPPHEEELPAAAPQTAATTAPSSASTAERYAAPQTPAAVPKPETPAPPLKLEPPEPFPAAASAPEAVRLEAPRPAAPEPAVPSPEAPPPAEPSVVAAQSAPSQAAVAPPPTAAPAKRKRRGPFDALAELEKLRKDSMRPRSSARNGKHEISRDFQVTLQRTALHRARHFRLSLQIEDEQRQAVDEVQHLVVDIDNASELEKLLLRLNIALDSTP